MKKLFKFLIAIFLGFSLASCATTSSLQGVKLDKETMIMEVGQTETLVATVNPQELSDDTQILWDSNNTKVATVDQNGVVTAIAAGSCKITVTASRGLVRKKDICTIKVLPDTIPVDGITLDITNERVDVGDTLLLTPTISPIDATNKEVIWSSSDDEIASVEDGLVTANKVGNATITATTVDGDKEATCTITVYQSVSSVGLDKLLNTVNVGDSFELVETVLPIDATNKEVTWTSSNSHVASVNDGLVYAVAPGIASITVTTVDGGHTATCVVTVLQPVTSVSLNETTLSLVIGGEKALEATVLPNNATNKAVVWSSSDESVVTVENGLVKAVSAGSATVTVTTVDGNKTATCAVTVTQPVTGVTLNKTTLDLLTGENETLIASISPIDATNKEVTWTSSDENVATVVNGKVVAIGPGSATVTVTTIDGSKTASVTVSVTQPVTSVSLNKTSETVELGENVVLEATVLPANASNKTVTWTSSNVAVATVNNGVVITVGLGSATIIVTTADGNKTATFVVNVIKSVEEVSLNITAHTLNVNDSIELVATVLPADASNKTLIWSSSNSEVAIVNNGVVTAKKVGNAVITVTTVDGGFEATCDITVIITPTSVEITNKQQTEIIVNNTLQLNALVSPSNATNNAVVWSSSDKTVATVSENGLVTALKSGTTTITVTTVLGEKVDSLEISVVQPVTGVELDKYSAYIVENNTLKLYPTVSPANATNKTLKWTSSDESVAIVADGLITALNKGTTTITVETVDGGFKASCTIMVVEVAVPATKVEIKQENNIDTIKVEETLKLTAVVEPENTTNVVVWASSNEDVATVDQTGLVTAHNAGSVTIVATTGTKVDTYTITVIKHTPTIKDFVDKEITYLDEYDFVPTSDYDDATIVVKYYKDGLEVAKPTTVGEYEVKATIAENYKFNAVEKTVVLVIEQKEIDMSNVKWNYTVPYTYNTQEQSVLLVNVPNEVTVSYENNTKVNAGTYEAKASLSYDAVNYVLVNNSVDNLSWTIKKVQLEQPVEDTTAFTYTGEAQTYEVEENDNYTITGNVQTNAGEYKVKVSINDKDNYEWNDGNTSDLEYTFVINTYKVEIPTANTGLVYNKTEQVGVAETKYYTVENGKATNAGTYIAVLTLKDANYVWATSFDGEIEWTIEHAKVNVNEVEWDYNEAFVYDKQAHTVQVTNLPEGVKVREYVNNSFTNVGNYTAIAKFEALTNYALEGDSSKTLDWSIVKATIDMKGVKWDYEEAFTYSNEEHEVKLVNVPSLVTVTYTGNKATNAGNNYLAVASLSYDEDNYQLINNNVTNLNWVINKVQLTEPTEDDTVFTYNGEAQTYEVEENDNYTITGNVQTNAGDYEVKVEINDKANYEWSNGKTDDLVFVFIINKANREVEVNDITVTKGQNWTVEYVDLNEKVNEYVSNNETGDSLIVPQSVAYDLSATGAKIEGATGTYEGLEIDATNGKFADNGGGWTQVNAGTIIKVSVEENAEVSVTAYSSAENFEVVVENGVATITAVANDYLKAINVSYSVVYSNTTIDLSATGANIQKATGVYEGLKIDATNGKFADNGGGWTQVNTGTIIKLNVAEGSTVSVTAYSSAENFEIVIENGVATITAVANDYLSAISVRTKEVISSSAYLDVSKSTENIQGTTGTYGPLSIDATTGKWANNNGGWIQVNAGTVITLNTVSGSKVSVNAHPSYADRVTITEENGLVTITANEQTYINKIIVICPKSLGTNDTVKYYLENQEVTPTLGGTYKMVVTVDGGTNYNDVTVESTLTIIAPVTGVELNKNTTSLEVGDIDTLIATVNPDDAQNKVISWESDNPLVATVVDGVVTAVAPGSAVITVTTADGNKTASCTVTVNKLVNTITASDINTTYGTAYTVSYDANNKENATVAYYKDEQLLNEAPTDAGTYKVVISVPSNNTYLLATKEITLTIGKLAVAEPTVSGTYTYDGTEQTVTLNGFDSSYMSITGNVETDAKTYDVVVTLDDNHEWAEGSDGKFTWTIAKRAITVTVDDKSVTYGDDEVALTYTVTGELATGHTNADVFTVSRVAGTDAHTYDITVATINENYAITSNVGKYVINKKEATLNGVPGSKEIELGDELELDITTNSTSEVIVKIYDGEEEVNEITAAGTYTVVVSVAEATNYKSSSKQFELTVVISCTEVTLSKDSTEIDVTEIEQITITINPSNTTDEVTITYSGDNVATMSSSGLITAGIEAGATTITVTCGEVSDSITVTVGNPWGTLESPISANEGINLVKDKTVKELSPIKGYVTGVVTKVEEKTYGNNNTSYILTLSEENDDFEFLVYSANLANGVTVPRIGDTVIASGWFTKYDSDTCEIKNKDSYYPVIESVAHNQYSYTVEYNGEVDGEVLGLNEKLTSGVPTSFEVAAQSGYYVSSVEFNGAVINPVDGEYTIVPEINNTIVVTINEVVAINSISIEGETLVEVDKEITLTVNVDPLNATITNSSWTVSDSTYATIFADGLTCVVTGVAEGDVTVEFNCNELNAPLTHTIRVEEYEFIESVVATFEFGENEPDVIHTSASGDVPATVHGDGAESKVLDIYQDGDYSLNLSNESKVYGGAFDEKGNSALKLGTSSKAGSFSFTVPNDVNKVIIYIAQYKANTTKVSINGGEAIVIETPSNNGEYTAIEIDTSSDKTIGFTTVSGGYRCMIDKIQYVTIVGTQPASGVTLNKDEMELIVGGNDTLTANVLPYDVANKNVTWSSSKEEVAIVENGVVTAVSAGTAVITVTTEDGGYTATCTVKVSLPPLTGLALSESTLTKVVGDDSIQLTAIPTPSNASLDGIRWTTSDETVVTVDQTGRVTIVGAGAANITVSCGGYEDVCKVTVTAANVPVTGVEIVANNTGDALTLTAKVAPDNATDTTIKWSSNDENIATVDNGVVTAKSAGTAVITAKTSDGGFEATYAIAISAVSTWEVTNLEDIVANDIVVIAWTHTDGEIYSMTNSNGTGSAPGTVKVTVNDNQLIGDIGDNIKWNISNVDGTLTIYPNGTTETWLYCTATNNGVRVGTNTNKTFTIDSTSGYLKHDGTSRYLGVYNKSDIRCYTNTTGNTKDQTISFYKNTNSFIIEEYCEHANKTTTTVDATCTETGSITVTCDDCSKTISTEIIAATDHSDVDTDDNHNCDICGEADVTTHEYIDGVCNCGVEESVTPQEPTVVLEITKDDFNSTSYAANNNTKTEGDYSYTSYQVMNQSSVMQWQKSKGYITIATNDFVKLELKVTAGTYTVTVGGNAVAGTTTDGVTTYDLTGLTGEVKISVGSATGKVDYLKFYK